MKLYNKLPSEILFIEDEYSAYCFNEACMYIISQLEDKKKPRFSDSETTEEKSITPKALFKKMLAERAIKNERSEK